MSKYLSPNIIIEAVSCLIAFLFVFRAERNTWRVFPFFLAFTCIIEITGRALGIHRKSNDWIYNIYLLGEVSVVSFAYRSLIAEYKKINYLFALGLGVVIGAYLCGIISHGIMVYNDMAEMLMAMVFIIYGLYYFYLLLNDEKHHRLITFAPFWWVAGTLLFFFGTLGSDIYYVFFKANAWPLFTNRYLIYLCLNIVLYTLWSYSFICRYLQRKSTG